MRSYYLDEKSTDLGALQARLEATDLIPSQQPLLVGIADKMDALKSAGIASLADLRQALVKNESLASLSKKSAIDLNYLQLLRRTIDGYFPKSRSLKEIDWLDQAVVARLKAARIANTRDLFDATSGGAASLAKDVGVDSEDLKEFVAISDLCRIQWVSPSFARVLVAAGISSPSAVAKADPEALCQAIEKANQDGTFYKGKVGLRDVRRLVAAAAYVP
ncbi:DUF4332 domain-containing protein [Sulfitobacter sp. MF3-043]|uniref:DUF4332 domain-containing protein n=1 Tax=Sulfitobacter sediminivivens TaxID=3252902 RepID=UPI0036DDB347